MKGILVGLAIGIGTAGIGLATVSPALAFDAQTCIGSYGGALPAGLTADTLDARCACVAQKASTDPDLASSLDAVFSQPLSERQAAMDANPKAKAAVEACRTQNP